MKRFHVIPARPGCRGTGIVPDEAKRRKAQPGSFPAPGPQYISCVLVVPRVDLYNCLSNGQEQQSENQRTYRGMGVDSTLSDIG